MKTSKYQVLKTIALCVVLLAAARTGKAQIFPNSYINVDWQVGVPLGSAYADNIRNGAGNAKIDGGANTGGQDVFEISVGSVCMS